MSDAPPEPPPPRPSTSPFGRFPTQIVGMLAVLVAGVAAVSFSVSGGGGDAEPAATPTSLAGTWESVPASNAGGGLVRLELTSSGGTLTAGGCTGDLKQREHISDESVFRYVDTTGKRGCPRVLTVDVARAGRDTLRIEVRRRGDELFSETLRRIG